VSEIVKLNVAKRLNCLEDRPSNISPVVKQVNEDGTISFSFTTACTVKESWALSRIITEHMKSILGGKSSEF